jgi:hypothetical protein
MADSSALRLNQVFKGLSKLLEPDPSVPWLTQIIEAYPSILRLTKVFNGLFKYLKADASV